jgi:hypothetical protein
MAVKADWGQSALGGLGTDDDAFAESPASTATVPKVDPFDSKSSAMAMLNMIDSTMPVAGIGLDTPPEELHRMLKISIQREARLDAAGITCDLKDCPEMSCLACPYNKSGDDDDPKQTLCRVGMEQTIISAYLLAQSKGEPVGQPR